MNAETTSCSKCGAALESEQRFCPSCGTPVAPDEAAQEVEVKSDEIVKEQSEPEQEMKKPEPPKPAKSKPTPLSIIFCIVAISFCLLYLGLMGNSLRAAIAVKANSVMLVTPATDYHGLDYQLVADQMTDAGFTNVETVPLEDLTADQADQQDTVERISIKGNSTFKEGATFAKDDAVIIVYHTLPAEE